jgi:hypothetical protein
MKALLFAAFLALTVAGTSFQARPPELRLLLQLEKTEYSTTGPVVVRIQIENLSPIEVVINSRLLVNRAIGPHEIFFQITGPDGKVVPFETRVDDTLDSRKFMVLESKRVFGKLYNLRRAYPLEAQGEYTLTAFYENKQDTPAAMNLAPAWKGRLKSNSVKFSVR